MKKYRRLFFLTLILAGVFTSLYASDIAYVSSKKTKVYKQASLSSQAITTLKQNDEVQLLGQKGVWLEVEVPNLSGWVSRYSISNEKPYREKLSIFTRLKNFFRADSNRDRLTLVSTAGGIRGLTEEQSDDIGKTSYESVELMESISIEESELEEFILEGKQ